LNSSAGMVPFNFKTACTSGGIGTPAAFRMLLPSCCKRLLAPPPPLLLLLLDVPDDCASSAVSCCSRLPLGLWGIGPELVTP
jgi:hypothetical protein